jgi:hypothetical protein
MMLSAVRQRDAPWFTFDTESQIDPVLRELSLIDLAGLFAGFEAACSPRHEKKAGRDAARRSGTRRFPTFPWIATLRLC